MSAARTAKAVPVAVGAPETTENNRENEIVRDKKHIPIVAAATAVKPLSSLYAEVTIFMKQAASRAIPICSRSIVFCYLAGCTEALDPFEVCKYNASLLFKTLATRNDPNPSAIT